MWCIYRQKFFPVYGHCNVLYCGIIWYYTIRGQSHLQISLSHGGKANSKDLLLSMTRHGGKILKTWQDDKHAPSVSSLRHLLVELFSHLHPVTQMFVCSSWCPKLFFHTSHRFLERQKGMTKNKSNEKASVQTERRAMSEAGAACSYKQPCQCSCRLMLHHHNHNDNHFCWNILNACCSCWFLWYLCREPLVSINFCTV